MEVYIIEMKVDKHSIIKIIILFIKNPDHILVQGILISIDKLSHKN